ncbi:MAG: hypothetical protein UR14_C0001G0095 [candidate division TM6 bacterium GW2011_GWE2_31_21]|nr:MAG: hypothetical protein UR14_C0001G0095 [candidate division TM6 bacterium GW2011_GWE2_31_21]KKP54025.1 MAG: hypothetical protein UR43_C0001G0043 [candidate division TM6 bacterium GW2011_GWF2_33_332]
MLNQQFENMKQVQDSLADILQRCAVSKSLNWNDSIALIERYHMTNELKKTWVGKLNESQQDELIALKQEFPKEIAAWEKIIKLINSMELGDPEGPDGERVLKFFFDLDKKMRASASRQRKLNYDILRSIKEGKLGDDALPLSPEGSVWIAKASLAYSLKRWEQLYQDIITNLTSDPKGATGKKIAKDWREHIEKHFAGTPPDLAIGTMLWQEVGRQRTALQKQQTPVPVQEQVKGIYVSLAFNPEAMSWIEEALKAH